MHELAIARSVVEIACRHAAAAGTGQGAPASGALSRVTKVQLKVGYLRQVVPSALAFNFEVVAQGTPIEGARLVMEAVPAVGICRECGVESRLEAFPLQCQACGGFDLQIVAGEELVVESLEIEEVDIATHN